MQSSLQEQVSTEESRRKWNETILKQREANLCDPRRAKLKQIVNDKGMMWAVAAMVDGSIGYHSPSSAENMIKALVNDEYVWGCERTFACFDSPISEIERDFHCLQEWEKIKPEKVQNVIKYVEAISKLDHMSQLTAGLMYPTIGI